jgi:hypothetical protein
MDQTNEEKLDMVEMYFLCRKNCSLAASTYAERYPDRWRPNRKSFKKIIDNLRNFGSFKKKKQRPKIVITEEIETQILACFEVNPKCSTREAAEMCGVSRSSVNSVLKKHKYHPYKATVLQAKLPGDEERRLQFCYWFSDKALDDPSFVSKIIWTDETNFSNKGMMNRHNNHYWSTVNPLIVREGRDQVRFSVNCWCALLDNKILAVHFYEGCLTGVRYRQLLENVLIPALEDIPLNTREQLIYQQDGAPPHNSGTVRTFLDEHFPNQWVATYGPIAWPPRSPDLTPLDFFLWGYLKDKLYEDRYASVDEMLNKIREILYSIHHTLISKATKATFMRAHACMYYDGGHFEHVLQS